MPCAARQIAAALLTLCCVGAPAWAQLVVAQGARVDIPAGATVDAGCGTVDVQGELNLQSGDLRTGGDMVVAAAGVFNGHGGSLKLGGSLRSDGAFNAGSSTVELTDGCMGNVSLLSGTLVFQNLVLSSTTGRSFVVPAGSQITVLGTLTLQGALGQNIQILSSGAGAAVIGLGPSATVTSNFVTVAGNVQIGAALDTVRSIPTLSEYGVLILGMLLALGAWSRQGQLRLGGRDATKKTKKGTR